MPRLMVDGIGIAYELIGNVQESSGCATPGGRFTWMPRPARAGQDLAKSGRRVLIYDRPNCGFRTSACAARANLKCRRKPSLA